MARGLKIEDLPLHIRKYASYERGATGMGIKVSLPFVAAGSQHAREFEGDVYDNRRCRRWLKSHNAEWTGHHWWIPL